MKSKLFIYVSLAVDILIAIAKFIGAIATGSSSMVSEGVHSIIDAISQLLLIWGIKTSKKQADTTRPFGYGRELYFWSFIVSLFVFLLGGCVAIYEGIGRLHKPAFTGDPGWNYSILAVAFVFTIVSLTTALKAFNKQRGHSSFWKAVTESKDPSTFIVLFGDIADVLGLVIAFSGIYLGRLFHNPYYDGIASILIGIILIAISLLLVRESKSLLMGETIGRRTIHEIIAIAEADPSVIKVKKHLSTYLAPEEVVLQLMAVFKQDVTAEQISESIQRIIEKIQTTFPRIKQIFIEPVTDQG
jgi:cation diffusion facilitator family transporter